MEVLPKLFLSDKCQLLVNVQNLKNIFWIIYSLKSSFILETGEMKTWREYAVDMRSGRTIRLKSFMNET